MDNIAQAEFVVKQAERRDRKNYDLVYNAKFEKGQLGNLLNEISMAGQVSECMSEILKVIMSYLTYDIDRDEKFLDTINKKVWSFCGVPKSVKNNGSHNAYNTYNYNALKASAQKYYFNAIEAQKDAMSILQAITKDGMEITDEEKQQIGYRNPVPRPPREESEGTTIADVLESKRAPKKGK